MNSHALQLYLPFLVLVPVLYFRARRSMRPQELKLNRLWIRPAILILAAGVALAAPVPGTRALVPLDWAWLGLAAVLGAIAGWHWGGTAKLEVHPEHGSLMMRGGMAGLIVILLLVLVKMGLRTGAAMEARAWHLNVTLLTDASIVFSALLFAMRGLEMFLRARKVMAGVQAIPPL